MIVEQDQMWCYLWEDLTDRENGLAECKFGERFVRAGQNAQEQGHSFEQALSTIYGVDLMPDNVQLCQDRLLCGREDLRHIVEQNIVCADALTYHYRFDGTDPELSDSDLAMAEFFEF